MKTWEKAVYIICILVGAVMLLFWLISMFALNFSGGGMLFQGMAIGLGTLLFWVPFLDAPLPGTVPLYKKWYGWVMLGIILFLFSIVYNYYH